MEHLVLHAHFDGTQIRLDDPVELLPDTKLLITVLQPDEAKDSSWLNLSAQRLEEAYGQDEPEYSLASIKEFNPGYERR